jgi:hypothetical protein
MRTTSAMMVGILILVVALAGVVGYYAATTRVGPTNSVSSTTSSVAVACDYSSTPQSVLSDFKANQAAANSKWLGKTICFEDFVESVQQNSAGNYVSCMWYDGTGFQPQSGCNDSLNTFDGWIIYNWASAKVAASVPTGGQNFSGSCEVSAYHGYGQFSTFGYKTLILSSCTLQG